MTTLLWASPLLAVILLLAWGRLDTPRAGLVGGVLAGMVAATVAPRPLDLTNTTIAVSRGLWLSWIAASVIFGGLFFQQVLHTLRHDGVADSATHDPDRRHRQLFAACFLIGPFAESATGFGVGYVIALALLMRQQNLPPVPLLLYGLFSQSLVPWGALAVGTVVGAHLADLPAQDLGWRSAILTLPLLAIWLLLFWRIAAAAGLAITARHAIDDVAWTAAAGAALVVTNRLLDPEVAAVAALGPLIVLRFWRDARPDARHWRRAAQTAAPYAALAAILIVARAVPPLRAALASHVVVPPPVADAAAWPVLLHPFFWLMAVPAATAIMTGRAAALLPTLANTWRHGRKAIAATVLFLVMAQLLAGSGIARGLAAEFLSGLGATAAIALSPVFAAIGGLLTGSTTGSNGLFMPSEVGLAAAAGLKDFGWLAAVQNTTASALTMLSPIRVAMGCALLGRPELERATYRAGWPLGALPLLLIIAAAALLA